MPLRKILALLPFTLAAAAMAADMSVTVPPVAKDAAAAAISAENLESHVRFLSDDLLEGRGPGTRGDRLARLYIQTELESMGFQPGGPDGAWQQPFRIIGIDAAVPKTWTFQGKGNPVTLKWWDDFIVASGLQQPTASVTNSELVFVGYGIQAPEYQWDDFKGADLKGKTLVMLNNDPDWDPKLFEGNRRLYYGRWTYKYESAARQGAAGAIIIHTTPSAGYPWQVVQTSWSGEQFELPAENEPRIALKGWTTEAAMRQLLSAAGFDLDKLVQSAHSRSFKPVPLGITTSLTLQNKLSEAQTANVIGVLPGSDPALSKQVVIYTAHHDHLGVGEPDKTGDKIYNGALDNAAGVSQVLTIARAYSKLPARPRRSVMFLLVAAEEQGLLGSQYFSLHPTYPAGRIAANINYDGGDIWGRTTDITEVGFGKSSLDTVAAALAAQQGRTMKGDQFPDRGFFYRSDQFSFAKIGVPALYFDTGTEFRDRPAGWGKKQIEKWEATQYHQPSDEIDASWNFEGMVEDATLGFYAGYLTAQADQMPTWTPGDEFEAARNKAIAAAGQ